MMLLWSDRFCKTNTSVLRFVSLMMLLVTIHVSLAAKIYAATGDAAASAPTLSLNQVVDQLIASNQQRSDRLKSYEGQRIYTVRYDGFPKNLQAKMVVSMRYEAPDTKQFTVISQSGPKLLVDKVLKRLLKTETDAQKQQTRAAVNLDRNNYEFSNLRYTPSQDGCSYALTVAPKKPNKYVYRGKIRLNEKDFAVCTIDAEPAENPSFWIKSTNIHETYERVGDFWLPELNKSASRIRFGGSATLTILYQDYKVQTR